MNTTKEVHLRKLMVAQQETKFSSFYSIRRFIAVFTKASTCPCLVSDTSNPSFPCYFITIHWNAILPPSSSSPSTLCLRLWPNNPYKFFRLRYKSEGRTWKGNCMSLRSVEGIQAEWSNIKFGECTSLKTLMKKRKSKERHWMWRNLMKL